MSEEVTSRRATGLTVDAAEVDKFAALAAEWWDPKGKFRPLHILNPVRLGFIRDAAVEAFGRGVDARAPDDSSASRRVGETWSRRRPLEGLALLDIGCGGGLVSEPLARLGAAVTGVDASAAGIGAARAHAAQSGLAIDYRVATAEALLDAGEGPFDIVLALEIVEHVADPDLFLRTCAKLVAPGGLAIVSTLNRTPKAFALAIVGAERVLRWLPRGTHDWSKFLTPEEVAAPLEAEGLRASAPTGVVFSPLRGAWSLSQDVSVNYMITAQRCA